MKRRLIAAIAALCLCLTGPASGAAKFTPPSFSIDDARAVEGSAVVFTVRKHGSKTAHTSTVSFATIAGVAKSPGDYTAVAVTLTFAAAETVKTVRVPTVAQPWAEATETFTGKLTAGTNARLYDGTAVGTIVDAPATVKWCAGGITVPIAQPCPGSEPPPPPPPATQTCPDGSVIPADQVCPAPPPPPASWVTYPAGTPRTGLVTATHARATKTCSSIYRTAETDRVGIAFRGVVAGTVYELPQPGPGTYPLGAAGWGHTRAKNIDGQSGDVWTVTAVGQPAAWATVAEGCLEAVKRV